MTTAPAIPASTVVLLRERESLEVYFVQRNLRTAFMKGAYVFPGGRLDELDRSTPDPTWCRGLDRVAGHWADLSSVEAGAYAVAAIRELFEEAGVLLATDVHGQTITGRGDAAGRLAESRAAVHRGEALFRDVLRREGWLASLDALLPLAHWVTPSDEPRRYDTRFYWAALPAGQSPTHVADETLGGLWLTPGEALDRNVARDIQLPPPTMKILEDLHGLASIRDVAAFAAADSRPRLEPALVRVGGVRTLVLPGDPLYPRPGEAAVDGSTRFSWADGGWTSSRAADA